MDIKPPNICKHLPKLAILVSNTHFHQSIPLYRGSFYISISRTKGLRFPLKLDSFPCVERLWMHRVSSDVLCCVFFAISSSGCHGADRCRLTCTTTLTKHTRTHLSGGLSPAGGGLLPNLQAGPTVFIFITHTLSGTDRTRAHTAREKISAGE